MMLIALLGFLAVMVGSAGLLWLGYYQQRSHVHTDTSPPDPRHEVKWDYEVTIPVINPGEAWIVSPDGARKLEDDE